MSSAPQPALLFSLNGTTNDSVLGIQGAVTGTTQYVNGNYGQAFNFLNTRGSVASNYITATQSAVTFSNTAGFSICFWVNPTPALTATQYWFGIFNGSSTEILRGSVTSGALGGITGFLPPATLQPTTRAFIPSLQWSHVTFVINTTTISMYVNGVYQPLSSGAYTSTGLSSFTGPINLGTSQAGSSLGLTGYMQDFRMYNTALSAPQIFGIYQSQGIPPRLTMVPSTGGVPSPTYAWPFQNSVIDAVQGVYPASANVAGVNWNTWLSGNTWPYYDSTAPVYGSNSIILNSINSAYSNGISYTINSPFGGSSSFAVCFWIKPIQTILNAYGYYLRVQSTVGTINLWLNSSYNPSFSASGSLGFIINGFPSSTASLNKWTHIAVSIVNTSSNITSQFFTNGVGGVVSTGLPLLPQSNVFTVLKVGFNNGGAGEWELGAEFGDLRIFNTALSPAQIQTIYQSGGNLYGAQTVQPSLLWSFNGSNVDSITQLSPSITTGTPIFVSGIYGQAVSFTNPTSGNPTSNIYYATIPTRSSTSGFTLSFWFKSTNSSFYFAGVPVALANSGYFYYYISNDGKLYPNPTTNGGPATPATVLNTWYNISGVFTNGLLTTYLNGVQSNTHVIGAGVGGSSLFVGSGQGNYGFIGSVQDLRLYNTALSAQQIQGIYLSGGVPPNMALTQTSRSGTSTTMNSG